MAIVVSLEEQRHLQTPSLNAMDQLTTLVGNDLDKVNALILEKMNSRVALIPQLAGYIIAAGGKAWFSLANADSRRRAPVRL